MTEYVNTNETLKIPLSKGKLMLLFTGALLFVYWDCGL
jgi:hypothetical protein